jgi:hypothetical protein
MEPAREFADSPDKMTVKQRLEAIAVILARGILRMAQRGKSPQAPPEMGSAESGAEGLELSPKTRLNVQSS